MAERIMTQVFAHRRRIIAFWMILCFGVSYLPVTNSWYLSMKGREDLTRLVTSMVRVKIDVDQKIPAGEFHQTMDKMFTELKIATGKVKIENTPEKGKVLLVEIVPEFALQPGLFRLCVDQKRLYSVSDQDQTHPSIFLTIDTPPPENRFVSV